MLHIILDKVTISFVGETQLWMICGLTDAVEEGEGYQCFCTTAIRD